MAIYGHKPTFTGHHTIETREKIKIAGLGNKNALGNKMSPEGREIQRRAVTGREHTSEELERMRIGNLGNHNCLGYRYTPEQLEGRKGSNNGRWRGGLGNLPYPLEFNSALKERIRERDNHTCQLCGVPQVECIRKLDVHHIDYNKENLADENLISLCSSCNSKVNSHRNYWRVYFTSIIELHF